MKGNRGSAAVIAVVFMMFLLIIGISFLPLMNSELKHASMDTEEQKAWYAAEAGIKYVQAYQKDASLVKEKFGISQKLSDDSDSAGYTLKAFDKTLGIAVDGSYPVTFPVADRTYTVYSEGLFNGVKKVITKEFVFESSNNSGGNSGGSGGSSGGTGEETVTLPGLIQAVGNVTIKSSNNSITGDIYTTNKNNFSDKRHDNGAASHSKVSTSLGLKTKIPDSVFNIASYSNLEEVTFVTKVSGSSVEANNTPLNVNARQPIYITWPIGWSASWGSGTFNYQITGESGGILFINVPRNVNSLDLNNGIVGPSSGKPLTIILNNSSNLTLNTTFSGNIRVLASGNITVAAKGKINGLFMLATNGDITFNAPVEYAFLSSNSNILLNNSCYLFAGQLQAAEDVTVESGSIVYNPIVASSEGFTLPAGMQ